MGTLKQSEEYRIIGNSQGIRNVFDIVEKAANSDSTVMVFGESGTGKELIARAIHQSGHRSRHAFVSENCGAISESLLESELFGHLKGSFTGADEDREGLFSAADKGTLFLDEISDMSQNMQRKLLRTLQEGVVRPIGSKTSIQVDSRVVCASNTDLKHLVERDQFRADLFYRLNVITIEVPPLRQRRGDIPLLIDHFLARLGEEEGVEKIDQFFPVLVAVLRCIEPWVINQIGSSHGTAERRPIPVLAHGKSYPTAVATPVVVP